MTGRPELQETRPRAVLRPSRGQKRRHRRRRSRRARPLLSLSHLLPALLVGLGLGFVFALYSAFRFGGAAGFEGVGAARLPAIDLPGATPAAAASGSAMVQVLVWAYLFGTPILFVLHRTLFWSGTRDVFRWLAYAAAAVWSAVIVVVLLSAV
jgi:hypothetical protein